MSPGAYKQARQDAAAINDDAVKEDLAILIDERPYLPNAVMDPTCEDSIKKITLQIVFHPSNHALHEQLQLLQLCQHHGLSLLSSTTATTTTNTANTANTITAIDDELLEQVVDLSTVRVEKVSGGITNTLFRVTGWSKGVGLTTATTVASNEATTETAATATSTPTGEDDEADAVLVRIFGAEGMIDRDLENAAYAALAASGVAPPYYGRFANGRLEGWCHYYRPLLVEELSHHSTAIAQAVAVMHRDFVIPDELVQYYPLDKPNVWTQLEEWWKQATVATFQTELDTTRAATLELPFIDQELQWIKETQIPPNAAILFCHNDLLAANILYNEALDKIQLIDFEYGGVNYRAFDIANHFNEWAGGPPVSPHPNYDWFPTDQQQIDFVTTYLQTYHRLNGGAEQSVDPEEKQSMIMEVHGFVLANHLYWGLWAVNQAATEGCQQYDYMEYAINRFKQYHVCKKICTEQQHLHQ